MKFHALRPPLLLAVAASLLTAAATAAEIAHIQGEMSGEVSDHSVILQSRLTAPEPSPGGDVQGRPGVGRFELATSPQFNDPRRTGWLQARPSYDYILKTRVAGLKPGTRYYYRLEFGPDKRHTELGPVRTFETHPGPDSAEPTSFVVVTGMNYHKFHHGGERSPGAYKGADKDLGYPALDAIGKLSPDFFVGTGDNVYYDTPRDPSATTAAGMRGKWQEQFVQPRYVDLFAKVPTYWEKDDHDYRYDDCDNTGDEPPSPELGWRIFREQVPVVDPDDPDAVTYRTYRVSKLLQVWFPEGRDYRDPNLSPDGPEKSLWGEKQRAWLQRTLSESDAPVKIIVSATPMIGPDDIHKKDNHCDVGGFRHEGSEFFRWARNNGFLDKGLYFVCGDRHWQYHSIHPTGFEEFSCGALVDANSRLGVQPGDKKGTDPDARIKQPYTSNPPSGGFLNILVQPADSGATVRFDFYDEHGKLLHRVKKQAK